ncbi:MAG: hypothetical protein NT116_03255, partial [Candidatus Parcubacteria bacterium]|nr:hypothetical protein [Candidatus Parcubacteria bacterium]
MFTKVLPYFDSGQIIQSKNVNSGTDFVTNAKLAANETPNGQSINYSLSNDGGVTWEAASNNILHNFSSQGVDLRWKAVFNTADITKTPIIDDLNITYETKKLFCSLTPSSLLAGESVTINAITSASSPSRVWTEIEKNNGLSATYDLDPMGGNDYQKDVPTNDTFLGNNNVSVFVKDSTTTYACNAPTGATWVKKSITDIPWKERTKFAAANFNGYMWVLGGFEDLPNN